MWAHMTEKPSEAYLAGYFFGRDGRGTERRFDDVGVELKAYAEGIVDGRRTARAAEDWRRAIEHELASGSPGTIGSTSKIRKSRTRARLSTLDRAGARRARRRAAEGSGTASCRGPERRMRQT